MKILYVDCFAGISGYSFLGAMINAGFDEVILQKILNNVPLNGYSIKIDRERINGIAAVRVNLQLSKGQEEKNLNGILTLIDNSKLPKKIKNNTALILTRLTELREGIKKIFPEDIYFSGEEMLKYIIGAIGISASLDYFTIEKVIISPPVFSPGSRQNDLSPAGHELPKGLPVETVSVFSKEPIDEFSSAIEEIIDLQYGPLPAFTIERIGYGAEKTSGYFSQGLRLIIGSATGKESESRSAPAKKISVLETNIDDMNPEFYPYLIDQLLTAGALDAFLTPVIMKGGRPGCVLTVLGKTGDNEKLADIVFQETTTLGIRVREEERITAYRQIFTVMTSFGAVKVKAGFFHNKLIQIAPEYRDCCSLAAKTRVPLREIYAAAWQAARSLFVSRETSTLPVIKHDGQNPP